MPDKRDREIIAILEEDSRTSFTEMGRRLRVSESTVRKRIERLLERGVIDRFTVITDPKKMGFDMIGVVGFDAEPSRYLKVAEEIAKIEEVRSAYTSTGNCMIMTEIWAKDRKEFSNILKKMGKVEGVKKLCPVILLDRIKG